MVRSNFRGLRVLSLFVAIAAFEIGAGCAEVRGDFGFGFGAFNYVPQPTDFLNSHALVNAANAPRGPITRSVYANNPNAYINRVRDNGFTPSFGIETRRSIESVPYAHLRSSSNVAVTSNPQPQSQPAPAAAPSVARPVVPIASFFNAARVLVWPGDSPVAGELITKRDTSDQACLVVHDMVEKHRSAPITTVTDARQKLLDYGRPALQEIRRYSTPRISDTFNLFLLSLYESLAQAVNPPEEAPAP
jgi:hypothetical protein